jgi:hypothetical protein
MTHPVIDARPSDEQMRARMRRDRVAKVVEGRWKLERYELVVWIDDFGDGKGNIYRRLRNGNIQWTPVTLGGNVTVVAGGDELGAKDTLRELNDPVSQFDSGPAGDTPRQRVIQHVANLTKLLARAMAEMENTYNSNKWLYEIPSPCLRPLAAGPSSSALEKCAELWRQTR